MYNKTLFLSVIFKCLIDIFGIFYSNTAINFSVVLLLQHLCYNNYHIPEHCRYTYEQSV